LPDHSLRGACAERGTPPLEPRRRAAEGGRRALREVLLARPQRDGQAIHHPSPVAKRLIVGERRALDEVLLVGRAAVA
jgi:hypothetical protein